MKFTLVIEIAFFLFTLSACKKESENASNVWTSKTWKRGINDINPSTNPTGSALYYSVANCEKDDTFSFDMNGKLFLNRNANKCDESESMTETTTYTLNRAAKELVINGTSFTLVEESKSQIKYYALVPTPTGFQKVIYLLQ